MEMRPFQSSFAVKIAKDPSGDAWSGARKFATTGNNMQNYQMTKEEYSELGGEYVKEYYAGNKYFATPAGEKVEGVNPIN
jgi:actin-related protein 5